MNNKSDLPIAAYTDSEFFSLEQKYIFSQHWAFAGLSEDIKQSGDYLTVQAGLNNILIIMNDDGRLAAFHNICRHRGMRLLTGKGNSPKRLTCPYHDWSYNHEGTLCSLPKSREEFAIKDKSCLSLKKANVGIWRGIIWVHPDANSISVAEWFSSYNNMLAPYEVSELYEPENSTIIEEINANWKIVVENYIDHYHLAQLHSGTLNMYDHKRAEFSFIGHHFLFWEPLTSEYQKNIAQNSPYPLIIDASDEKLGAWVPMLFPGIGLAESESSWSVFHIVPLSADKTKVVIRTKMKNCSTAEYLKQGFRSAKYWSNKVRAKNSNFKDTHPLGSADFMKEDIYVCEQLQKSLSSPYFEFGPSAERGESPVREHKRLIWDIIKPYWQAKN